MIWTSDQEATLARAWTAGDDCAVIGRALGGVSRGAVSKKRIRLGLPDRSAVTRALLNVERGRALSRHAPTAPKGRADVLRMGPLEGSTPRPWSMREARECAFPVLAFGGELTDEAVSCCLPVEPGSAYCLGHNAILFGRPWPPIEPANLPSQWEDA